MKASFSMQNRDVLITNFMYQVSFAVLENNPPPSCCLPPPITNN